MNDTAEHTASNAATITDFKKAMEDKYKGQNPSQATAKGGLRAQRRMQRLVPRTWKKNADGDAPIGSNEDDSKTSQQQAKEASATDKQITVEVPTENHGSDTSSPRVLDRAALFGQTVTSPKSTVRSPKSAGNSPTAARNSTPENVWKTSVRDRKKLYGDSSEPANKETKQTTEQTIKPKNEFTSRNKETFAQRQARLSDERWAREAEEKATREEERAIRRQKAAKKFAQRQARLKAEAEAEKVDEEAAKERESSARKKKVEEKFAAREARLKAQEEAEKAENEADQERTRALKRQRSQQVKNAMKAAQEESARVMQFD